MTSVNDQVQNSSIQSERRASTNPPRICINCANCIDQYNHPISPGGIPHCSVVPDVVLGTAADCSTLRVVGMPSATRCGLDGELFLARI